MRIAIAYELERFIKIRFNLPLSRGVGGMRRLKGEEDNYVPAVYYQKSLINVVCIGSEIEVTIMDRDSKKVLT